MPHYFPFPSLPIIGNDSKVDGLVNFEKLRMIAKEIRHVGRMASVNMDPALMFRTRLVSSLVASVGLEKVEFRAELCNMRELRIYIFVVWQRFFLGCAENLH